jgi:hypothetical protein
MADGQVQVEGKKVVKLFVNGKDTIGYKEYQKYLRGPFNKYRK